MRTVFLRVLEAEDKAAALLDAVRISSSQRYDVKATALAVIPGSPFAYWLSHSIRDVFSQFPPVEYGTRLVRQGLGTADDFRFVRLWWEIDGKPTQGWFTFVRGGRTSAFYGDVDSILNWGTDGRELKAWATISTGGDHWSKNIRSTELYFKPGLTWPLRAPRFAPYPIPSDSIFSIRGYACIAPRDELLATLSIFSSSVFDYLFKVLLGRHGYPEFVVGVLQKLPLPASAPAELADLSGRAWALKRSMDTPSEISHAFTLPVTLQVDGADLKARAATWSEQVRSADGELAEIQAEIDARCFALYGINDADRRTITEGFGTVDCEEESNGANAVEDDARETSDLNECAADATGVAAELVSWAMGVIFGRFDIRLATGARSIPTEPDPFDSLPACSPGMLVGTDGLPFVRPPVGYPLVFPEQGIRVDDPGHAADLTVAVRNVFDVVFDSNGDRWWNDVSAQLDQKDHDLRGWLAGSFFEYHLKRYSKSRRKAPILWQLGTPSARYSVWLYAHGISSDSFFQLQNDVVGLKLSHEERQLTNLMQSANDSPSASERKAIATQETLVEELRIMLEEIKRVAPLWNPNLDDGVVLTMAPLWRLVPQHKSWQQELKGKWDELSAGKYDWAHLAMHLWPERVVPKCAADRSIAIAHGLEDLFWLEDFNNKWRAVEKPAQEREYVASYWARSPRTKLLTQARDLWVERYLKTGRNDFDWWHEVEMGRHDDHSLAIRLWPRRVCETALVDSVIADAHELKLPKLSAFSEEEARQQIEAWLHKMSSRQGAAEIDRSFMSAAFGEPEPLREWKAWWSQLEDGQVEHLPVARYFRPEEVSKACKSTLELADAHEVRRFFFVDTGSGLRKRLSPAEEILREVGERTSPAVKAALKSLVEAPGTITRTKSARSRSRR